MIAPAVSGTLLRGAIPSLPLATVGGSASVSTAAHAAELPALASRAEAATALDAAGAYEAAAVAAAATALIGDAAARPRAVLYATSFIRCASVNLRLCLEVLTQRKPVDPAVAAPFAEAASACIGLLLQLAGADAVPLSALLARGTLPALVRAACECRATRLYAWEALVAFARRMAPAARDFDVRVAADPLWRALTRVGQLLDDAADAPAAFFGPPAATHRELILALQLLLVLSDDGYTRARLQQHRIAARLAAFAAAPVVGLQPGPAELAAKLQGVSRKLAREVGADPPCATATRGTP